MTILHAKAIKYIWTNPVFVHYHHLNGFEYSFYWELLNKIKGYILENR